MAAGTEFAAPKARITSQDTCMECRPCQKNCPEAPMEVSAGVGCAVAEINQMRRGRSQDGASCACGRRAAHAGRGAGVPRTLPGAASIQIAVTFTF